MRFSESISVVFFAVFLAASVLAPLQKRRRQKAAAIGIAGLLAAGTVQCLEVLPGIELLRDLIPGLFLLMAYWQSGQFFTGSNAKVQGSLRNFDARWFPWAMRITSSLRSRPTLSGYLEAAYLMCYPIVPLGVGVLYLVGQAEAIDQFWSVVLPPSYVCYASTALFQSLPPRSADGGEDLPLRSSGLRSLNLWILRRASIQANTLPSGHVANSLAIALVLLELVPVAGAVFLWIAGSITVASVILRYHYAADAVLAIALASLSFVVFG